MRAWELRVRTLAGSGLWLRTESFRRFLAGSEAHHAEEAAKRGHLREYTAWAVAVGELDRWSRAVAASSAAQADPAAARYPLMVPALLSGSSGASKQPSSSGSSGGLEQRRRWRGRRRRRRWRRWVVVTADCGIARDIV